MSVAQGILIIGGLLHFFISMVVSYFLYWQRVTHPEIPAQRYGLVSHKASLWNGFFLISLAVAIEYSIYVPMVNNLLALMVLGSTLISDFGNIWRWIRGVEDQFRQGPEWRVRGIGLVHIFDLVVTAALLVSVTRYVLGI